MTNILIAQYLKTEINIYIQIPNNNYASENTPFETLKFLIKVKDKMNFMM